MGKYELVRQLATGGMAEVFLAKTEGALGFEKTVVVKRIRPHLLDDPQFLQMFLNEAKIAAQLDHPNIVQVFDFGEAEGAHFLAMEYIDGPNLRALSTQAHKAGKPIPFPLCAKILSYACEGLAYAHEYANPETGQPLDIVHRDVSPDNVVIAKNGAVKVVDFGIAKAAETLYQTQSGLRKGKLAYMSPEYLKGAQPDRRSDVFALGVVLYELISNKKPYDAESEITLMHAMIYESMVPVRTRRSDVPRELERIVEKALARDRGDRYPSCREVQADLERFVVDEGEPLSAIHISKLVASLQPELDAAAALAKTPSRSKSSPGTGKTPPGQTSAIRKSPSGQKTPPKQKSPSGQKTPPKATGISGEKRKVVTPPKAVEAPALESDERTIRLDGPALVAQAAALYGTGPSSDSTVRLTAKDLAAAAPPSPRPEPKTPVEEPKQAASPEPEDEGETDPGSKTEPVAPARPKVKFKVKAKKERAAAAESSPPWKELGKKAREHARIIAIAAAALVLVCGGAAVVWAVRSPPDQPPPPPPQLKVETVPEVTPAPQEKVVEELPPEPVKETKVEAPKVGFLEVTSNVPAIVKIGKRKGRPAPYKSELKPGKYEIELADPVTGFWMKRRIPVELKANETEKVHIDVAKGKVLLNSFPGDAKVFIDRDGEPRATTPAEIDLNEGQHTARFIGPKAQQEDEQPFVVQPGQKIKVFTNFK